MPYKVYKSGVRYCVHKKNSDGSKGKQIGCHATNSKAQAQMRALYAAEGKEANQMNDTTDAANAILSTTPYIGEPVNPEQQQEEETKETQEEKHYDSAYVPWGVTSFADLAEAQDARAAALRVRTLSDQLVEITNNIMYSDDIEDKAAAVSNLADEYKSLVNAEADSIKEANWMEQIKEGLGELAALFTKKEEPKETPPSGGFMLWKEDDGSLRWFARYSNNFRDEDTPPEIISSDSHRRFVELVDRKEAPLPELWLWHVPEWKLGEADWLAYDDSGFALASGTIDRGKEMVAEQIAKSKLVGVSHGMPVSSIERDPDDPTVIVEHETREISPLPAPNAANKLGDWVLLGNVKEGNNMPIPEQKKQDLLERWNIDAEVLEQLEALNAEDAGKATEEGRESKETEQEEPAAKEDEVTTEEEEPAAEAETTEEEETPVLTDEEPITREEIADAITTVLKPYMDVVDELRGDVKALKESDEEKIKKATDLTPTASVSAIMAERISAIGDKSTRVAKNTKLDKASPEEAEVEIVNPIPFLNQMIKDEHQTVEE
jgi:hypothetical protein